MDRRTALKVIATSAAAAGTTEACASEAALPGASPPSNPLAAGTLADPDLVAPVVPWDGLLTEEEMKVVAALCDLILPGDERSPAPSQVGVPAYVNEYVSAPYPAQQRDRVVIRGGLTWLNRQAAERFGADFSSLTVDQQIEICDPIRHEPDADPALKAQARFFDLFRDLTSTGFWTTEEGMADLGYIGNVPLPSFDGPPPEVIEALGLTDADLE